MRLVDFLAGSKKEIFQEVGVYHPEGKEPRLDPSVGQLTLEALGYKAHPVVIQQWDKYLSQNKALYAQLLTHTTVDGVQKLSSSLIGPFSTFIETLANKALVPEHIVPHVRAKQESVYIPGMTPEEYHRRLNVQEGSIDMTQTISNIKAFFDVWPKRVERLLLNPYPQEIVGEMLALEPNLVVYKGAQSEVG